MKLYIKRRFQCRVHPRYKVQLQPRCACEGCWFLWFYYHAPYPRTGMPVSVRDTR